MQLQAEPDLGDDPCFWLWPENVWMWQVFLACRTQWRQGFGGPTGLDYSGVRVVLEERFRLRGRRLREAWQLLDAMEIGALAGWGEQRDEAGAKRPAWRD